MKSHTETEENYLKGIFRLSQELETPEDLVSTNSLANYLDTSAASVTDMVKKLSDKSKKLVLHTPYKGVKLTAKGECIALKIIRKHRLWEVFLVEKLNFSWDNVHDVAEQLEHVDSAELITRLDEFLGRPAFDPHGDPIPSETGEMQTRETVLLSEMTAGKTVTIAGVTLTEPEFLQTLDQLGMSIGKTIKIIDKLPFDNSVRLEVNNSMVVVSGMLSGKVLVLQDGR